MPQSLPRTDAAVASGDRSAPTVVVSPAVASAALASTALVSAALTDRLPLMAAFRFGALLTTALATAVWLVAHAALDLLPSESLPYYGAGLGAALFAAMLALWIHGRFLDRRPQPFANDGRLMASRLQSLLAAAFGAKLGVLLLAVFALRVDGVKFAAMATFCITFAAVALVSQLAIAGYVARAMTKRSRASGHVAVATPLPTEKVPH